MPRLGFRGHDRWKISEVFNPGLRETLRNNGQRRFNYKKYKYNHITERSKTSIYEKPNITCYRDDKCPVKISRTSRRYRNFLTLYEGELRRVSNSDGGDNGVRPALFTTLLAINMEGKEKEKKTTSVFGPYDYEAPFLSPFFMLLRPTFFVRCIRDSDEYARMCDSSP